MSLESGTHSLIRGLVSQSFSNFEVGFGYFLGFFLERGLAVGRMASVDFDPDDLLSGLFFAVHVLDRFISGDLGSSYLLPPQMMQAIFFFVWTFGGLFSFPNIQGNKFFGFKLNQVQLFSFGEEGGIDIFQLARFVLRVQFLLEDLLLLVEQGLAGLPRGVYLQNVPDLFCCILAIHYNSPLILLATQSQ